VKNIIVLILLLSLFFVSCLNKDMNSKSLESSSILPVNIDNDNTLTYKNVRYTSKEDVLNDNGLSEKDKKNLLETFELLEKDKSELQSEKVEIIIPETN